MTGPTWGVAIRTTVAVAALGLLGSCAEPAGDVAGAGAGPPRASAADPVAPEPSQSRRRARPPRFRGGAVVVSTDRPALRTFARPRRSARSRLLAAANPIDQRLHFVVVDVRRTRSGKWFQILAPERPNGSTAWVRAGGLSVRRIRHRVEIDLSTYTLRHYRGKRLVHRFRVGVGRELYPTPLGVFYVWARVDQPSHSGPYGRFALGLSGFSPVLSDWPGGGRAAIHGTANSADRGAKVSHGCIRVFNDDMAAIEHLPMGTPVIITR